jgi:hypothetical protein
MELSPPVSSAFPSYLTSLKNAPKTPEELHTLQKRLQTINYFSSRNEKNEVLQMAAISMLLYKEASNTSATLETQNLFKNPDSFLALPPMDILTPHSTPSGLRCQAFLADGEIIIGMRGTELRTDFTTKFKNLVADLGIGRHKSNEDIVESIKQVDREITLQFGSEKSFGSKTITTIELIVSSRIEGTTSLERTISAVSKASRAFLNSAPTALKVGAAIGGSILAGATIFLGTPVIAAASAAAQITAYTAGAVTAGSTAVAGITSAATAVDGYDTLKSYVKAIDEYVSAIKSLDGMSGKKIKFAGHSLGGFLAAVTGLVHAGSSIFSFNGPGVTNEDLVIYSQFGVEKERASLIKYNSYVAACDAIGNLGRRDGTVRRLEVPIAFNSPLDHHGIDVLRAVLHEAPISRPFTPFPKPALLDEIAHAKNFI